MSSTILGGKFTVYYEDENRRKQIRWTGTTVKSDVQKMIDVYDSTEDLMTIATQSNDGLIFSAETPGEYTIGKIDAGEIEPWFIDMKSMEHIVGDYANFTGCALKTSGWTRAVGTNAGIVCVPVTSGGAIVIGDIGLDITHADADAGTLLDVIVTGGATDYLWIRPDSSAAANNFDSTSGNLTCNANVSVQNAAATTGEMVWGNPYTQGAIVPDTHIFILQDGVKVTSSDATAEDWWTDGHIDRNLPIKDYTTAGFPTIDEGYLTVKADQYGSKYTYAIIRMNTTTGGNVSAGLSSGADGTNTTGYASITISGGSGNWTVGDEIQGDTSGARGIITQIDSPGATATLHFYYIGDPLTAFNGSEAISNNDDTGAATGSGAVANQGPALTTWFDGNLQPTYTFTNTQADIDDDTVNEEYAIAIHLQSSSLAQMHEYNKYAKRRGSTVQLDGIDGEQWIGLDLAINYASISGTVPEGSVVTGKTSGATATLVSNPGGTSNTALLRNTRGTFIDGEAIYETDGVNEFDASGLTVEVIVPVAESSFGTLAGTTYFASRGVLLTNYKGAEENSFVLIDATGTTRQRPTSITMTILNAKQYDYISCWRLLGDGLGINKTEYTATGGEAIGDATIDTTAIAADVPGKVAGGTVVLVDVTDNNEEYFMRYSSYTAASGLITLANAVSTVKATSTETTVVDTGNFTAAIVKVGDLFYNTTRSLYAYVKARTDDNTIVLDRAITGQVSTDSYELNCVPVVTTSSDQLFFPIVWKFMESDGTASASMQYVAPIFAKVIARNTSDAAQKIKGFTAAVSIDGTGGNASVTRIPNTVYGS
jgi:hypothetical protein